jgi:hypothetical protein
MRERVAGWPDSEPAPDEEADFAAVGALFSPGLTRDEFRLVRNEETPPQWRTQGRRRAWGQVKKSAA